MAADKAKKAIGSFDKGKSFVLYNTQYDAIKSLPDEAKARLLDGIFLHAREEEKQDIDPILAALLYMITSQIDRDKTHYIEVCKRRSDAGKKGGRPLKANGKIASTSKAKKANGSFEKQKKATESNGKQSKTKKADNENDNDNENDINTTTLRACAREGELKTLLALFAEYNGQDNATPAASNGIQDWADIMGTQVVEYAIRWVAHNRGGNKRWGYVETILRDWESQGLKTVEALRDKLERPSIDKGVNDETTDSSGGTGFIPSTGFKRPEDFM